VVWLNDYGRAWSAGVRPGGGRGVRRCLPEKSGRIYF
jgi:hypothetical protein